MRRSLLAAASFALLLVLVFHPPVLGIGGELRLAGWDATRVFWADIVHLRRCLLNAELPLWLPYDRGGYSFVAEPQSGVYDPLTWLVVLISLPFPAGPSWLISLKALIYYLLAATGVAALLRRFELPPWANALGVMIYVVGGRMDKLKDQSALWPSAWAPWLLFVLHRAIQRPSWRRGVALGTVGGLCVLSGYPPIAVRLAMLLLAPMGLAWAYRAWRQSDTGSDYLRDLGQCLGLALLIASCLCAAQVVATYGVLDMTKRAQLSTADILASHFRPRHALSLWAPGESQTGALLYASLASGIGLLGAVFARDRLEAGLMLTIGAFGFLLACGEHAPVLPALASLPGFRSFRIAGHFVLLSTLATVLLAPLGLHLLSQREGASRWAAPAFALAGFVLFALFAHQPNPVHWLAAGSSAVLVGGLPFVAETRRSSMGTALVLVAAVDLFFGTRHIADTLLPPPDGDRQRKLAGFVDDPNETRMADYHWAADRAGTHTGVRDLVGARPALTDKHYMLVYYKAQKVPGVLEMMGVSVAAFRQRVPISRRLAPLDEKLPIYRVPKPWPAAFLTRDVQRVETPEDVIKAVRRKRRPRLITLPPERLPELPDEREGSSVALTVSRPSTNELRVDIPDLDAPAWLVVNEAYDPGWRAELDGNPVQIHRVNLLHRAVQVDPGNRELRMRYEPPGVRGLSLLYLLTLFGCFGVGLDALRARREPS